MREHRWETRTAVEFREILLLCDRLTARGFRVRPPDQVGACYFEEFRVAHVDELEALDPWPIEEVTLIEVNERWDGDFFVLAGRHHELFREHPTMEAYASLSHPWRIPADAVDGLHAPEAMSWIGFRDTHGFIRGRVVPRVIVTPGESLDEAERDRWVSERADAWNAAIEALELPLFVDWSDGMPVVASVNPDCRISASWPDAFGPCQFEYVVLDRYELLLPAARLVGRLGIRPGTLRTFLSGWPRAGFEAFRRLQPTAQLLYRGFVQARVLDLPAVADAVAPWGRALMTLCEFQTGGLLPGTREAYVVVGVIGGRDGFTIELRLNRRPLPDGDLEAWLTTLVGAPLVYSPLGLY